MRITVVFAFISLGFFACAQDYCADVQASGITTCHECVEITLLGGRPDVSSLFRVVTKVRLLFKSLPEHALLRQAVLSTRSRCAWTHDLRMLQ
jgi:hypothetical protein